MHDNTMHYDKGVSSLASGSKEYNKPKACKSNPNAKLSMRGFGSFCGHNKYFKRQE